MMDPIGCVKFASCGRENQYAGSHNLGPDSLIAGLLPSFPHEELYVCVHGPSRITHLTKERSPPPPPSLPASDEAGSRRD